MSALFKRGDMLVHPDENRGVILILRVQRFKGGAGPYQTADVLRGGKIRKISDPYPESWAKYGWVLIR